MAPVAWCLYKAFLYYVTVLLLAVLSSSCGVSRVAAVQQPGGPVRGDGLEEYAPAPWLRRKPVHPLKCLPQLLCIGTQKGGTTSWHDYLLAGYHPSLHVPRAIKELHYFDALFDKGWTPQTYFAQFPLVATTDDPQKDKCMFLPHNLTSRSPPWAVRMEATPRYLMHPSVPPRVKQLLPDVRLLVLLRQPGRRVVSHFNMEFKIKKQQGQLKVAPSAEKQQYTSLLAAMVDAEVAALSKCYKQHSKGPEDNGAVDKCLGVGRIPDTQLEGALATAEHVWRSVYADHLARWLSQYPPENFLIWSSEDFKARPAAHMQQMAAWLGVDPALGNNRLLDKQSYKIPYVAPTPKAVARALSAFLQPHNQRLFSLLRKHGFRDVAQKLEKRFANEWAAVSSSGDIANTGSAATARM